MCPYYNKNIRVFFFFFPLWREVVVVGVLDLFSVMVAAAAAHLEKPTDEPVAKNLEKNILGVRM